MANLVSLNEEEINFIITNKTWENKLLFFLLFKWKSKTDLDRSAKLCATKLS